MASTALEEKIEKIRLRNEEIKRRYEEVEADKKNAAKLDALVKPVPAEDWPERKEPPEFSAPAPKHANKLKHSVRKHNNDQPAQYYTGNGDGKKAHNFGDGQGPPPDPKYNFLADSEREEHGEESPRDTERNRGRNKPTRGVFRRRGSGRDWHSKEQWNQQGSPGDASRPDYEAWRAERNRIDEARISRQRTAEGNWRREWDNDKVHLADEVSKRENRVTLGDVVTRQEHNENEKLYRPPRTALKNPQHSNARESFHGPVVSEANKVHGSASEPEKRVVIATDRNIKVVLNSGSTPPKSSVMSVKVSPPNIAGTGRVGPRQRPRVMYSSQSETETSTHELPNFTRQKSAEEKSKNRPSDQTQKATPLKSPHPQRKREGDPKSPYPQRKDNDRVDKVDGTSRSGKKDSQKSPYPQRRGNAAGNYPPKSPRVHRRSTEGVKNDSAKSPRAQQDRNREKRNTFSGSEETKGENSNEVVIRATDAEKSKKLLSDVVNTNKENENVPITQSSTEEKANSAETLESDKKCFPDDNIKNYSEPEEQSSPKSTDEVLQSAENNSSNETIKQSESEKPEISASSKSDNQVNSNTISKNDSEHSEKISIESSTNSAEVVLESPEKSTNEAIKQSTSESLAISAVLQTDCQFNSDKVAKNDSENLEKISLEASANPDENSANETEKQSTSEKTETSHKSSIRSEEIASSAENGAVGESKEIYGEASGSQEPKATSNDVIVSESASNQALINCSANSGLNDSGFIELPSNDSIHDISCNVNTETSDFAETSVDSVQSENEVIEIQPVIENFENQPQLSDAAVENVAESSSSDTEKTAENSSTNVDKDATKISQNDVDNLLNLSGELQKNENDSTTSSNVHEEAENNMNVTEKYSNEVESTKLEKEQDNIAESVVHEDMENNSSALKSEEKDLHKTKLPAEGSKDVEKLQNTSNEPAIVSENFSINETASISKNPNDINKENTTDDNKKVEVDEEQTN